MASAGWQSLEGTWSIWMIPDLGIAGVAYRGGLWLLKLARELGLVFFF